MTVQPFHHGNLRAVLLDQAERTLREGSVDDLSLRRLAREAGVSHGAPRSHFIDRQALLDALAERGFVRLTAELAAAGAAHEDLVARLRAVAAVYVGFAVEDAALLELMFSTKTVSPPPNVRIAAEQMFSSFGSAFDADHRAGRFAGTDLERTKLLFVATLQGVAALIASHRISREEGTAVVSDAVDLLTRAPSGAPAPSVAEPADADEQDGR